MGNRTSAIIMAFTTAMQPDPEKSIPFEDIDVSELGIEGSVDRPDLFLGHLKESEVRELLVELGLLDELGERGYSNLKTIVEFGSLDDNRIHIRSDSDEDLFFLRLKIGNYPIVGLSPVRLISIDWFLTQNIRAAARDLYPGQKYPGLGSGVLFVFKNLVRQLVEITRVSGIITVPEYFHDAMLFTRFMECKFANPEKAADFQNLQILRNIRKLSTAIHSGQIVERKTGEVYRWRHGEMLSLKGEYFNRSLFNDDYRRSFKSALNPKKYIPGDQAAKDS